MAGAASQQDFKGQRPSSFPNRMAEGGSQRGPRNQKKGKLPPLGGQADSLDEQRVVHFKKGKQLGKGYYIVEISSTEEHFYISAFDVESPESYLIDLPSAKAQELMGEFEHDYDLMADSLQVMNKRLYLLNPKFSRKRKPDRGEEDAPPAAASGAAEGERIAQVRKSDEPAPQRRRDADNPATGAL